MSEAQKLKAYNLLSRFFSEKFPPLKEVPHKLPRPQQSEFPKRPERFMEVKLELAPDTDFRSFAKEMIGLTHEWEADFEQDESGEVKRIVFTGLVERPDWEIQWSLFEKGKFSFASAQSAYIFREKLRTSISKENKKKLNNAIRNNSKLWSKAMNFVTTGEDPDFLLIKKNQLEKEIKKIQEAIDAANL